MSLSLAGLSFSYGRKAALTDIDLVFEPMFTALIGPNGAGKSTLLKCMAGLASFQGTMTYGKERIDTSPRSAYIRQMSYLPQYNAHNVPITVLETVLLGLLHDLGMRISGEQLEKAFQALGDLGIGHFAERRLDELSGGQQQLVHIAQTMVKEPKILLLDEPLAGLDIHHQLEMLELIRRLTKEKKLTTVAVMHDLNLAARYADRIALLKDGRLYRYGEVAEVLTADTIREVYQVDVQIAVDESGIPRMHYLQAIG